jgi:hypothetical protein
MIWVHLHVLHVHEVVSRKTDFLYGLCKNDKIWYQDKTFSDMLFCLFCKGHKKYPFFMKLFMSKVEYGDAHAYIFLLIFLTS